MGRPQKEIDSDDTPAGRFAAALRAARERAGMPGYRTMAALCPYTHSTLSKAASGQRVPSWGVVKAYLASLGSGEDLDQWLELWNQAMAQDRGEPAGRTRRRARHARPSVPATTAPAADPEQADTPAAFVRELCILRTWADLTMEQISRRSRQAPHSGPRLPVSTISDVLRRESLPRLAFVESFVRACGGKRADVRAWSAAWQRISLMMIVNPVAPGRDGACGAERSLDGTGQEGYWTAHRPSADVARRDGAGGRGTGVPRQRRPDTPDMYRGLHLKFEWTPDGPQWMPGAPPHRTAPSPADEEQADRAEAEEDLVCPEDPSCPEDLLWPEPDCLPEDGWPGLHAAGFDLLRELRVHSETGEVRVQVRCRGCGTTDFVHCTAAAKGAVACPCRPVGTSGGGPA